MLNSYILRDNFIRAVKCGFYLDFFLKKICEVFVRNVFICASYLFGEKYMIEYFTKIPFDNVITNLNIIWNSNITDKKDIFILLVSSLLYLLSVLLIIHLLYC